MDDISNLRTYDKVLIFGFNNDIRDQEDDPFDLFDLKAALKKAINFPNSFDRELYTFINIFWKQTMIVLKVSEKRLKLMFN